MATRGTVGVTVDHRLYDTADYPLAAADIAAAVETARADPRVDADRIAIWLFSGGGLLLGDWLRRTPDWLRSVAATYPVLAPPAAQERRSKVPARGSSCLAGTLPIVLTRVGRERPQIADTVETFVAAARLRGAARHR